MNSLQRYVDQLVSRETYLGDKYLLTAVRNFMTGQVWRGRTSIRPGPITPGQWSDLCEGNEQWPDTEYLPPE